MGKLKKQLLTAVILIAAVTALLVVFGFGTPASADTHDHSTMTPLSACPSDGVLSAGEYYLTANIDGNITVTGDVTLCLNGHNVQGDGTDAVITVSASATFTLCDSKGMGCITGGHSSYGGGVNVQGTFIMNGGNIADNTATNGGGVYVNLYSGSMLMTGGAISNNTATNGGGVFTTLNIPLPPPIILSKASSKAANVLDLSQDDWRHTFTMIGGEISDNNADTGGGVYADFKTFTMSGTSVLSGNTSTANGGGVFVSESATFSMDGGAISGNSADTGGGVEVYGTFEVSNNPNIMGNTNTDGDNDNVRIAQPIIVTSALTSGAQIGVYTMGEITSGYGDNNKDLDGSIIAPDNYFVADNSRCALVLQDGEVGVVLANQVAAVTVDGNETVYDDILDAWDAANDATTSQDSPAVVKLLTNVTTEYNLPVANGSFITLDLNGYTLRYVGDLKFSVITVNGALTLQDSRPQAEHNYNVTDDGLWVLSDSGEHTLYGGVITGGKLGGVNINNGTFTMNGGSVSGNYSSRDNSAGGVYVGDGCAFTLTGGSISGNTDAHGVYVSGAFTMNGGKISNNTSPSSAVMVLGNGATFTMTGGAISDNTSTNDAAGVTITSGCMFTMSGTAVISGNTGVYWGGVYMSGGTITMEGGEISGNTATHDRSQGGGVHASGTFTMNGGKISGNQAANGGGVYFSGGTFTMEGGEIIGNTATNDGGGVFVRTGAFKVSGAVNITGNKTSDGDDSNVNLLEDLRVTVAGALTDGAQIGVNNVGVAVTGFTQDDKPSKYFIPDNPVYNCVYLSDASLGAVTIDEHDIVSYEAKQPTCTEDGYQAYESCTHCDYAIAKVDLPALGHDYGEWTVVKQATQDEEGTEQRICSRDASHVETRPIPKLPATQPAEQPSDAEWIWIVLFVVLLLIVLCEVFFIVYILRLKNIEASNGKGVNNK